MFRRKPPHPPVDPTADFWAWWSIAAERFEAAIESGDYGTLTGEMSERVHAIDDGLEWEFSKGDTSMHILCVTSAGNPELRAVATRWRLSAPPPSTTWEYRSVRSADPAALTSRVDYGGHIAALGDTRFRIHVDDDRQEVDLVVFHPVFAAMTDSARGQLMFLIVDWMLGEEGVERWVGAIEWTLTEPDEALPADALVEITDSLASRHSEPEWVLMRGTSPDAAPVMVTAMRPLKPVDYPLLDLHCAIRHSFESQTDEGFPQQAALDQLREFEHALEGVSPEYTRLAALVTSAGVRTFHIYCDSQSPARSEIDTWLGTANRVEVEWSMDPAWDAVRSFR